MILVIFEIRSSEGEEMLRMRSVCSFTDSFLALKLVKWSAHVCGGGVVWFMMIEVISINDVIVFSKLKITS